LKKLIFLSILILILLTLGFYTSKKLNLNPNQKVGQKIDSFNGVDVFFNGGVGNVEGRNLTKDGYNLGLKYQCVEFVKRYYYEELNHKMPDSYGHAKSFFNPKVEDGGVNKQRNLTQYTNSSNSKPKINDLVVYSGTVLNKFGHVPIVSDVRDGEIEIIQQNPGPFGSSRETFKLINDDGKWRVDNDRILGWLRK